MKRLILLIIILIGIIVLYRLNIIPHIQYSNEHFDITPYISINDQDQDGLDDQSDLLKNAKAYIKKKPKYKSKYYASGYPDDEYGVCSDVVAFSLLDAGYDLQELVDLDIKEHSQDYHDVGDRNIDFRRVRNLKVYFDHHAISLTTNIHDIEQWHGGDIVVFKGHIGIVSDKRNYKGIPFIIHHANPYQIYYEEDILENHHDIIGHYRISK